MPRSIHLKVAGQHFIRFLKGDISALGASEDAVNKMLEMGMKGLICIEFLTGIATSFTLLSGVMPDANQKAKHYFGRAIDIAMEIGAKALLGQGYLGLGQLYSAESDKDKARLYISQAIPLIEECELDKNLKQAKEALEFLK
jgi:hypothetical protein